MKFDVKDVPGLSELLTKFRDPNSLLRGFSISSSWNALIIVTQFILSPIISRIYPPEEYGLFALYNSLVLNISLLVTLKYSEAIVLQNNVAKRNRVIGLCLFLIFCSALLTSAVFYFLGEFIGIALNDTRISGFLLIIPMAVVLSGVLEVLIGINITESRFSVNGFSGFVLGAGSRLSAAAYGFFVGAQAKGIILGDLLGKLGAVLVVFFSLKNWGDRLKKIRVSISFPSLKATAIELRSFPLYFLPSNVLLIFSAHLPIYFFQYRYGAAVVGSFGMAIGVLEIFNRLVPYSVAPAFLRKVSEINQKTPELLPSKVYLFFLAMLSLSTGLFSVLAGWGQQIFSLLLGSNWAAAGSFGAALSISYSINFVSVALSEVYNVFGKQRLMLFVTIAGVVLRLLTLTFIAVGNDDPINALVIYSVVSCVGSILLIIGVFLTFSDYWQRVLFWMVMSLAIVSTCFWLGNSLYL